MNTLKIEEIGVVGAGVMGSGLALDLALSGHNVLLLDLTDERLDEARRQLLKHYRFYRFWRREESHVPAEEFIRGITFATDYIVLEKAEFVIENVTEKWEVKKALFRKIDSICPPETTFASNTSVIPISKIASETRRPEKVIGLHFMNPVHLKAAVEVIVTEATSDETLASAKVLLSQMSKEPIVVNDSPGFVSNRVLMLTVNEAIHLLDEEVASAQDVDRIFKLCLGNKMGPLETADLIGLDTILYSLENLQEILESDKFRPCSLLREMVGEGLLGKKSGQGFYSYPGQ